MQITNKAARTVADWPMGTRFRIDGAVLYVKVGETAHVNTFRVSTFRNGGQKEVNLTVSPNNVITFVDYGRKP